MMIIDEKSTINASNNLNINTKKDFINEGSNIVSKDIEIKANKVNIKTLKDNMDFFGGNTKAYTKEQSTKHILSNLEAKNLNIQSSDKTTIQGAKLKAKDSLEIQTKDLEVSSVQDKTKTNTKSRGTSVGLSTNGAINSVGINKANSRSTIKTVVQTNLEGKNVNIKVANHTKLKGATIAAVNEDKQDNGRLNLSTNTLEVSSLNNIKQSNSKSIGLNVGLDSDSISSVGIEYSNDKKNSKVKTLGTIGSGNIDIANKEDSNIKMLNRDIKDNKVDIYNIESHKGLSGKVDTRLLTENGRKKINDDMKTVKVGFYDTAKDIMTKESLDILDSFTHQGNKVAMYDGVKNAIKNSEDLQNKLADPNLTKEQKDQVLREIATSVAKELNIKLSDVSTVASESTNEDANKIKGVYHEPSGDIAVNDTENKSTGETINTLGNEMAHLLDSQRGESREGTTSNGESFKDEYSNLMGDSMEDYANFAMDNYSDKTLANTNNHNGMEVPKSVFDPNYDKATQNFENRNANGELEYRREQVSRGVIFDSAPADHKMEVIIRTSPNEFTKIQKEKYGEPIKLGDNKYGYVVEALKKKGKLTPVINDKKSVFSYKSGQVTLHNSNVNDYKKEDKLLSNHYRNIQDKESYKLYPSNWKTLNCAVFGNCKKFYNSNTYADDLSKGIYPIIKDNVGLFINVPGSRIHLERNK